MTESKLVELIKAKRDTVLTAWANRVYATYPFDTGGFLRSSSNEFSNPVGARTVFLGELLLDSLCGDPVSIENLTQGMEEFIRIRAVQDFTPEQALAVLYLLKECIADLFKAEIVGNMLWPEMWTLSARLDGAVLLGFGAYMRSRENMWSLRLEDFKRRNHQIMRRAELLVAAEEDKL